MTDYFDFSQLKSFKTPENWIETAINIPQKKKPLPFILRPYVIGTAASLVIVAAAVLTILLSSGGKPPLGNERSFAVQPAVTVPTEIIEETNASGEVIATHVVPAITDGTTPQATEIIEVTNALGEVIATQAVPVTSPSAGNTAPQTTAEASTTSAAAPTAAETTASETPWTTTVPEIISTTDDISEEVETLSPAWDETQTVTEPVQETHAPDVFTGNLTLIITPDSPLFGSVFVKLDFYNESGAKVDSTVAVKPILNEMTGYKTASFYPYGNGMNLYCWQTYTLRVYDTKGNSRSVSFTPSFAGGFAVNV